MYSWRKLIGFNHKEFQNQELKVIKGEIPKNLKGTLYRNTSAILNRKNELPGHLFDGVLHQIYTQQDGVILKVQFDGDKAIASYKFVQTEGYILENQSNEFILSGLGRLPTGNRFTKIFNNQKVKNSANTSVLPLTNGPLLALYEGGFPTSLDKTTLKTIGLFDGGMLKVGENWSAHPKVCSKTNLVYNIGTIRGATLELMVTEMDQSGKILRSNKTKVNGQRFMCHDFILAGDYLVIPIYPQFLDSIFDLLLASKPLSQNIVFKPEEGIQIIIFDKKTMQLVCNVIEKDSYYVWHYANGMVNQDGNIVFTQSTYKNFDSFQAFSIEQLKKGITPNLLKSVYEQIIIRPNDGKILQRQILYEDTVEFLVVEDADVGQKWNVTYGCIASRNDDYFDGIVKYTDNSRQVKLYDVGIYISEALHVQDKTKQKGEGWLLLTYFDGNQDKSYVDILDCVTLESVCLMELPEILAISFHGRFEAI